MNYPTDPSAELGALGCVIEAGGVGGREMVPDLFATDAGMKLSEILRGMIEAKTEITPISVGRLASHDLVQMALGASGPTLGYWMPILREKRALRGLHASGNSILKRVQELDSLKMSVVGDIVDLISTFSSEVVGIARGVAEGERRDMKENVKSVIDALVLADQGHKPACCQTGIPTLDWLLGGGLRSGDMTVLGARTSVGKSALACWIARAACKSGKKVLYASREMTRDALTTRLLGAEGNVHLRICDGFKGLSKEEEERLLAAIKTLKGWNLTIRDNLKTISSVRAEAAAIQPDLVIIDHIGIFDAGLGKKFTPYDSATANSNAARDMAFDTKCAVLVLAQVNRQGAGEGAPEMHHLKSTGALEEDARAVLLLHRSGDITTEVQQLQINLAKNTHGPLRMIQTRFDAARCTFNEIHDLEP